jgi:type II secretory pathway component PulK
MRHLQKSKPGIALFILMTALVVLSLVVRELMMSAGNQATRVRNSGDRIQALYLARSSLNLARFILALDRIQDSQIPGREPTDRLDDFWSLPNYFPLKIEEIRALTKKSEPDEGASEEAQDPDFTKKCEEFFDGFPGQTTSITTDLAGKLSLNDLVAGSGLPLEVLTELLRPHVDFIRHLNEINTTPEGLAREIRDYMDPDNTEAPTNAEESYPYSALQLDYGPKDRAFTNLDELKLVPHVDETVFQFLSEFVNPYTPTRPVPMINLNTVSKEVFQALLKGVSDAEIVAEKFVMDRAKQKRVYTKSNFLSQLSDAVQISGDQIRNGLLTGVSDSFKIETTSEINKIELKLETVVARNPGVKKVEPILIMRTSP